MKFSFLFAVILPVFLAPIISLRQDGAERDSFNVYLTTEDQEPVECVQGGLEYRYRFELQKCERSRYWFDSCSPVRIITHRLSFDPIAETYSVTQDFFKDTRAPIKVQYSELEEALGSFLLLKGIRMGSINPESDYISLRVISECKGEYSETLERASYFMSLGIIKGFGGFDTGWVDFAFDE